MIIPYLVIGGIVLGSLIISLTIVYLYVKLIYLISERYTPYSRNKSKYPSGNKGQYTSDTINIVKFLKGIYSFTHLHDIWSGLRYPFRKPDTNSAINKVYCNEEYEGYDECNGGSPKPRFHTDTTLSHDKNTQQPNANKT